MSKTVKITYYRNKGGAKVVGHSLTKEWERSEYHCVGCGGSNVWCEEGPGDYYEGPEHMCEDCGEYWNFNGSSSPEDSKYDVKYQTLQQLRGKDV